MCSRLARALALAALASGCAISDRPYRVVDPARVAAPDEPAIRVVSAPKIREVSAAGLPDTGFARPDTRAVLAAPHRTTVAPPSPQVLLDLRAHVGQRDKRDPLAAVLAWSRALGVIPEGFSGTTGDELVAWADASQRLADPTDEPRPGDFLVFDHASSDSTADLVALVVARDERGVTEMLYLGNGIVRRGFVDFARPTKRRDAQQRIVNTYLRHGKRWPAKGTRYLTGELLAHVIHLR